MYSQDAGLALAGILVAGLAYAAWTDWRTREVPDSVWQAMAVLGAVVGPFALGTASLPALALWVVVAAFVLQHLFPWDRRWVDSDSPLPGYLELGAYVGTFALLALGGWRYGIGPGGLPIAVIAVFVTVLLARALFEVGVLYGGADAKALMVAGLLVPLFPNPLLRISTSASQVLGVYPFSLDLLMDAALLAIAIPLALAVYNARRGDFEFPRAFTSYRIPVDRLPDSFVWLRDPLTNDDVEEAPTSEEDRVLRERQRDRLKAEGATEVWVTPQLPFVVLLWGGAVVALLAGNLLFDLLALA
ncbi:MAG TPA: prepilin peptidase [Thermoplasmata archaeon]|nr:prepilin peptidase [Thermoplasmata archaeon]